MFNKIIELILITLLPFLELRASIPYGILKLQMNWVDVFIICVITNIILGIIVYFLLDKFIHLVIMFKPFGKLDNRTVDLTL